MHYLCKNVAQILVVHWCCPGNMLYLESPQERVRWCLAKHVKITTVIHHQGRYNLQWSQKLLQYLMFHVVLECSNTVLTALFSLAKVKDSGNCSCMPAFLSHHPVHVSTPTYLYILTSQLAPAHALSKCCSCSYETGSKVHPILCQVRNRVLFPFTPDFA